MFTDSPMSMLDAEESHRQHAIIEQVNADLKSGALAHLPSGYFAANSAWLVLAAIAFNLTRAAGTLASRFHARATGATSRQQLITVPAGLASSARRIRLHLPTAWPWREDWQQLFDALHPPPAQPDSPHPAAVTARPAINVEEPDRPPTSPRPNPTSRP